MKKELLKDKVSSKKSLLIICYGLGGASGFVFERMVKELSKYFNVDLCVSSNSNQLKNLENISNVTIIEQQYIPIPKHLISFLKQHLILVDNGYLHLNDIFQKYLIKYLGHNPLNTLWSRLIIKKINTHQNKYDAVLGFMDYNGFATLEATLTIAKKLRTKSIIYSTDANPVTLHWDNDKRYLRSATKLLSKYFNKLDGLYFANERMLQYEKEIFSFRDNTKLGVVYTASQKEQFELPVSNKKMFLYTGVLWGPRKAEYIFKAFKMLLKRHPDAELCFVGSRANGFSDEELFIFTEEERKSIHSEKPTKNLKPYFEDALCLLDINADYEGDPFLSSKITNYIKYNRPILCEASQDSSARMLFSNLSTIYMCDHNPINLYQNMCEIIDQKEYNYDERKPIIEMFSIENIIKHFSEELKIIIE